MYILPKTILKSDQRIIETRTHISNGRWIFRKSICDIRFNLQNARARAGSRTQDSLSLDFEDLGLATLDQKLIKLPMEFEFNYSTGETIEKKVRRISTYFVHSERFARITTSTLVRIDNTLARIIHYPQEVHLLKTVMGFYYISDSTDPDECNFLVLVHPVAKVYRDWIEHGKVDASKYVNYHDPAEKLEVVRRYT